MKNTSIILQALSLIAPLLSASSAFAIDTDCATFSQGQLFRASHSNSGYAKSLAVDNCKKSGSTLNSECDAHAVCTIGRVETEQCSTYSRGLLFESSSEVRGYARHKAVADCRRNGSTLNSECDANITCQVAYPIPQDPYPNPYPYPDPYPNPGPDPYPYPRPDPRPTYPSPSDGLELVGQWRASNCSYCFLQVSTYGGRLYGDMTPWDLNRSASNGPQPIVMLSRDLLQYRGDTFQIERLGGRYDSRLRIINLTSRSDRANVLSAELESYTPAPNPDPYPRPVPPYPQPLPMPPRPREVICTIQTHGRVYTGTAPRRREALDAVLAQCAANSRGRPCRAADAVCTRR